MGVDMMMMTTMMMVVVMMMMAGSAYQLPRFRKEAAWCAGARSHDLGNSVQVAWTGTRPVLFDCPTPLSLPYLGPTAERHGNNHTPGRRHPSRQKPTRVGIEKPTKQKKQNTDPRPALGSNLRRLLRTQRRPWKTHGYARVPCSRNNGYRRKRTPMAW